MALGHLYTIKKDKKIDGEAAVKLKYYYNSDVNDYRTIYKKVSDITAEEQAILDDYDIVGVGDKSTLYGNTILS